MTDATTRLEEVAAYLQRQADERSRWKGHDFMWAQMLLWTAILSSFLASLHAAGAFTDEFEIKGTHVSLKWLWALLAGLPALTLVIERTFRYTARHIWNATYEARFRSLQRDIQHRGKSEVSAVAELNELETEMTRTFPEMASQIHPELKSKPTGKSKSAHKGKNDRHPVGDGAVRSEVQPQNLGGSSEKD
jgi:hypothetical protein